jgi:FtsP/CotA-like multicopper oxidase with cupredoxin domain
MFIVDDAVESKLNLPRNYGVDDLPIIVHDSPIGLSSGNPLDFIGELFGSRQGDSLTLVNGQHEPYVEVSTSLLRLRLLNASIGDVFDFSFDDGRDFSIIASEGGLFDKPVIENNLLMSPGERYEVVVAFEPGETVRLNRSLLDDNNGARADSESTLEFRAVSALQNLGALPDVMVTLPETSLDNVARTRAFDMSGVEINGLMMHMDRIDQVVHAGIKIRYLSLRKPQWSFS